MTSRFDALRLNQTTQGSDGAFLGTSGLGICSVDGCRLDAAYDGLCGFHSEGIEPDTLTT